MVHDFAPNNAKCVLVCVITSRYINSTYSFFLKIPVRIIVYIMFVMAISPLETILTTLQMFTVSTRPPALVLQTVKPKMLSPKNNQSESTTHFRM